VYNIKKIIISIFVKQYIVITSEALISHAIFNFNRAYNVRDK